MAWDLIKFDLDCHCSEAIDRRLLYKIFCIFNRFCEPTQLPLKLPRNSCQFLLQKLGFEHSEDFDEEMDLDCFLATIKPHLNEDLIGIIDRLYNKLVRFVLHQDRVRYRIIRDCGRAISFKALTATPSAPKTIVVNHRSLIIYEDDIKDLDRVGKGLDNEPHGHVLHQFPLAGALVRARNARSIFKKASSTLVILAGSGTTSIELNFNALKDDYKMFKFTEAIEQASELTRLGSDPLTKLHQMHRFRPDCFEFREPFPKKVCDLKLKHNSFSRETRGKAKASEFNEDFRRQSAPDLASLEIVGGTSQVYPEEPVAVLQVHVLGDDSFSDSGISTSTEDSDTLKLSFVRRMEMDRLSCM